MTQALAIAIGLLLGAAAPRFRAQVLFVFAALLALAGFGAIALAQPLSIAGGAALLAGLLVAAAMLLTVGFVPLSDPAIVAAVALAGFASGTTTPSRDMLVRGATPAGATGKVFGFVYSGLDLGAAVTPPVLGFFLDRGEPRMVFVLAATSLALTIATAIRVGKARAQRVARAEPAPAE